jgi:hypothetical protein
MLNHLIPTAGACLDRIRLKSGIGGKVGQLEILQAFNDWWKKGESGA